MLQRAPCHFIRRTVPFFRSLSQQHPRVCFSLDVEHRVSHIGYSLISLCNGCITFRFHFLSRERYWIASAMARSSTFSVSFRSAMVRATFKILWYPLALNWSCSKAVLSNSCPGLVNGHSALIYRSVNMPFAFGEPFLSFLKARPLLIRFFICSVVYGFEAGLSDIVVEPVTKSS